MSNTRNLGDIGRNTALKGLGDDNLIINGNFDIWQRGTSFSNPANLSYTADRWVIIYDGSGASRTISRQSFALGQTEVPNEPKYFFRYEQSVAGSGTTFSLFAQRIEDVRTLAGQNAVVSFWAKSSTGTTLSTVTLSQHFGTGGSPSATVYTGLAGPLSLSTSWTKYTFTATLPSISGKTLGTNGDDYLRLYYTTPFNSTFTIDIAQVKLEPGDTATDFVPRRIEDELAKCQRYYQIIPQSAAVGTSVNTAAGLLKYPHMEMRTFPTISAPSTITVDFFGFGSSTTSSYTLFGGKNFTAVNFNSASPARTAFVPVSLLNDITLDAEL